MFQPDRLADLISPPVKDDPFSLDALIAWLETKDPDEGYCFLSAEDGCLWARYTKDNGGVCEEPYEKYALNGASMSVNLDVGTWRCDVAIGFPRTFGAALSRARALQKGDGQ